MPLDATIYDHVPAALEPGDKRALLAVLDAVGRRVGEYAYLEIGSWQGGSLQPVVADARCVRAYAFDARVGGPQYEAVNADKMRANLARVPGADLSKLTCIDEAASPEHYRLIDQPPTVCYIDGLHTPEAAWQDYCFCRAVAHPQAVYLWHDVDQVLAAVLRAQSESPEATTVRFREKVGLLSFIEWASLATPELTELAQPLKWTAVAWWYAGSRKWRRGTPESLRRALAPVMTAIRRALGAGG